MPTMPADLKKALLEYKDGDEQKILQLIQVDPGHMQDTECFGSVIDWQLYPIEFALITGHTKLALMLLDHGALTKNQVRETGVLSAKLKRVAQVFHEYRTLQAAKSTADTTRMGMLESEIGSMFQDAGMYDEALKWLESAVNHNDAIGMWYAALLYSHHTKSISARQSVKKDLSKAVNLYIQSYPLWTKQKDKEDIVRNLQLIASSFSIPSHLGAEQKAEEKLSDLDRAAIFEANRFLIEEVYVKSGDLTKILDCVHAMVALDEKRARDFGKKLLILVTKDAEFAEALSHFYAWGKVAQRAFAFAASDFEKLAERASTPLASAVYDLYQARAYFADEEFSSALVALKKSYMRDKTLDSRTRPVEELIKWTRTVTKPEQLLSCLDSLLSCYWQEVVHNPNVLPVLQEAILGIMANPVLKDMPTRWNNIASAVLILTPEFMNQLLQIPLKEGEKEPTGRGQLHVILKDYYYKEMQRADFKTDQLAVILKYYEDGLQVRKDESYRAAYVMALKKAAEIPQGKDKPESYLQKAALEGDVDAMIQLVRQYNTPPQIKNDDALGYLKKAIDGAKANNDLLQKFLVELVRLNVLMCNDISADQKYLNGIAEMVSKLTDHQRQQYQKDYVVALKQAAARSNTDNERQKYLAAAVEQHDVESMLDVIVFHLHDKPTYFDLMQKAVKNIATQTAMFSRLFAELIKGYDALKSNANYGAKIAEQVVVAVEYFLKTREDRKILNGVLPVLQKIKLSNQFQDRIVAIEERLAAEKKASEEKEQKDSREKFIADSLKNTNININVLSTLALYCNQNKKGEEDNTLLHAIIDPWIAQNFEKAFSQLHVDSLDKTLFTESNSAKAYVLEQLAKKVDEKKNSDDIKVLTHYYYFQMNVFRVSPDGSDAKKTAFHNIVLLVKKLCLKNLSEHLDTRDFLAAGMKIGNASDPKLTQQVINHLDWQMAKQRRDERAIQTLAKDQHYAPALGSLAKRYADSVKESRFGSTKTPDKIPEALTCYLQLLICINKKSDKAYPEIADQYNLPVADIQKMHDDAMKYVSSIMCGKSEYAKFAEWILYLSMKLALNDQSGLLKGLGFSDDTAKKDINTIISLILPDHARKHYITGMQNVFGITLKLSDFQKAAEVKEESVPDAEEPAEWERGSVLDEGKAKAVSAKRGGGAGALSKPLLAAEGGAPGMAASPVRLFDRAAAPANAPLLAAAAPAMPSADGTDKKAGGAAASPAGPRSSGSSASS